MPINSHYLALISSLLMKIIINLSSLSQKNTDQIKTYQVLFVGKHQDDTIEHKWVIYDCLQVIHEPIQNLFRITSTHIWKWIWFCHLKFLLCFTNSLTVQAINNINLHKCTRQQIYQPCYLMHVDLSFQASTGLINDGERRKFFLIKKQPA